MPIMDDRFQNFLVFDITMSAANILTFQQINTGVSLGQGLGIVIDEIRYVPTLPSMRELTAATDDLKVSLCTTDTVSDIGDYGDSRVLDNLTIVTAVTNTGPPFVMPFKHDFSPPLIIATPTLHIGMATTGAAAASRCRMRVSFRYIKLTAQEYLEVAETFLNL